MNEVIRRKVGLVSCSGEEIAEGTVSRLATLRVLHELRPTQTVTICLPLFLAGGEGDRDFARFHPTITVDGCALRCAARGTEMYSGKPVASVVVSDLLASVGLASPRGRRSLDDAGRSAVEVTAQRLTRMVDELMQAHEASSDFHALPIASGDATPGTCACGGGIPSSNVAVGERTVRVVALPLLFAQFQLEGREPGEAFGNELLDAVKIYNDVPAEEVGLWRDALLEEYRRSFNKEPRR